jgi:ubiquinone/menaquinone biosynthesis C-methylase UbiE
MRKAQVPSAFDRVAPSYDLLARLSPGYHRHLRLSAERLGLGPRARILDVCCGTGLSTLALCSVYPDAEVTGLDASPGMLAIARRKPFAARVRFVKGDAMRPREAGLAGPYDGIFMAYGIRNVPDADLCLRELGSLLSPGGAICFHELVLDGTLRSRVVWEAVTLGVIVPFGFVLSGTTGIYRYLRRSVLGFDDVRGFEARLARAGYADIRTHPMDGWPRGIVHSIVARRGR